MKIEIFYSPGCVQCAAVRQDLKLAAQHVVKELEWRELNVLDELDYAVHLGVFTLPAVVIDGELAFACLPTQQQLRAALARRILPEP